jgi:hypothetical protein
MGNWSNANCPTLNAPDPYVQGVLARLASSRECRETATDCWRLRRSADSWNVLCARCCRRFAATNVPAPVRVSTYPSARSWAYALRIGIREIPSSKERDRVEGTCWPALKLPFKIATLNASRICRWRDLEAVRSIAMMGENPAGAFFIAPIIVVIKKAHQAAIVYDHRRDNIQTMLMFRGATKKAIRTRRLKLSSWVGRALLCRSPLGAVP